MYRSQIFNPYLPAWEYVPDGEPHVFGDRVYVYGSHDKFGAPIFCVNDYVCWSAPVTDLSDWRFEGIIYTKTQDPHNRLGLHSLYAPDVVQGSDGRFYMYYAFDAMGEMGVAVCDFPAGEYSFYGYVHFKDGHIWGHQSGEPFPFDPGVLKDDDGRIYLYSGFALRVPPLSTRGRQLENPGGVVLELEEDMLTIKHGPKLICPAKGHKGAFPDHAFFEASSIRKVEDKYCFVYSSQHNHDLCYALSDHPAGPFTYGGVLVDSGDLFLQDLAKENAAEDAKHQPHKETADFCGSRLFLKLSGKTTDRYEKDARNYLGNNHGGLLHIGEKWYIFYHRQTNRTSYARQACAEELKRRPDGGFYQAEITSCGLNGGPLQGKGRYPARIACNLWSIDGVGRIDGFFSKRNLRKHPYFTQSGQDHEHRSTQYIANMRNGAAAGFKYFQMDGSALEITAILRSSGEGVLEAASDAAFTNIIGRLPVRSSVQYSKSRKKKRLRWYETAAPVERITGETALYFRYIGSGHVDFRMFELK